MNRVGLNTAPRFNQILTQQQQQQQQIPPTISKLSANIAVTSLNTQEQQQHQQASQQQHQQASQQQPQQQLTQIHSQQLASAQQMQQQIPSQQPQSSSNRFVIMPTGQQQQQQMQKLQPQQSDSHQLQQHQNYASVSVSGVPSQPQTPHQSTVVKLVTPTSGNLGNISVGSLGSSTAGFSASGGQAVFGAGKPGAPTFVVVPKSADQQQQPGVGGVASNVTAGHFSQLSKTVGTTSNMGSGGVISANQMVLTSGGLGSIVQGPPGLQMPHHPSIPQHSLAGISTSVLTQGITSSGIRPQIRPPGAPPHSIGTANNPHTLD